MAGTSSDDAASRIVEATVAGLAPLADPAQAEPMARYMRDQFTYLGVPAPQRTAALKAAWKALPALTEPELGDAVRRLWQRDEREYQYAACDLLGRELGTASRAGRVGEAFLTTTVQHLVTTRAWWDSVDALRKVAVAPLVAAHPRSRLVMVDWAGCQDRWLVRSAIIHQLGYRDRTDEELLFACCAGQASNPEFFVAKAIGWALRQHARLRPAQVVRFVDAHPELTPLARREALKHLT